MKVWIKAANDGVWVRFGSSKSQVPSAPTLSPDEHAAIDARAAAIPWPLIVEKGVCDGAIHYWLRTRDKLPRTDGPGPDCERSLAWMTGGLGEDVGHRGPEDYPDDPEILAHAECLAAAPEDVRRLSADLHAMRRRLVELEEQLAAVRDAGRAYLAAPATDRGSLVPTILAAAGVAPRTSSVSTRGQCSSPERAISSGPPSSASRSRGTRATASAGPASSGANPTC